MKNYSFILGLSFLAFCAVLNAQKVDVASLKGLKIRNVGPAAMSGRITAIDVDLSNTNRIYAGAASGGVWLSENGGIDWTPIFDEQPNQAIGAITINQKNPAEVWVGTGEGNPRNSQNSGGGVFKSMDGGKTWTLMGLEDTKVIHRIIVHRDNPDVVYVGAQGSAWGKSEHRGVYRTTNGGKTWEKILYVNDEIGIADLVVDPSNPSKMIAAMWEFGRQPWFFNSGGKGSGIYVTHDGGSNWKRLDEKNGMPEGMLGRVGLAIAPSSPNIVYALIEAKENALYKSTDGGNKFVKIADEKKNIGNRPFYYYDIFVDPQNENRVYSLYSLVSRSEDGGKNFEVILPYAGENAVHPDHHAFWIDPNNPSYMINGNDGGLYISRDKGKTWRFAENIPVGQFYHINYDMSYPYNISGGLQDNGSWVGPSAVWKPGGIRNSDWQEVFFGDGFDVLFHPKDNRFVYAMSQGGNLGFIDRQTGKTRFIKPVHPEGEELRFHWNAGIAQDPFRDCGVYYGSQYLHKSSDCGTTWEIISPDLTTNDSTKQQQIKTGGLTIDNTTAENHTTILAIAPSPVDEGTIWVGTDDGNLQLTRDGGKTWTNLASRLTGMKAGSWIPFIEVSQKNAGEAFVVVNDYRRNDWRPMAFHTSDFGKTFKQIVNEKQVQGHALAIIQDLVAPNLLWLGTDFGLYFTIDGGTNWNKWMNGYPSVSTIDLKIHPREHDLIVGTFGRSIWVLDDIRPIRAIAQSQGKVLDAPFKAFESPDAYLANYRSYDGTRFVGDGIYRGDNRSAGAMMTLWVKPMVKAKNTEKEDTKKDEKKKVKIQIINNAGDTIRTYTSPVDTGMNRIYWNLRQDGVRYPSREKAKAEDNLPPGNFVLPGKYQVLFTYETHKDSTTIQVHFDPRLDVKNYDVENIASIYNDYYALVKKAADGYDRVRTAKESIEMVQKMMSSEKDSTYQEIHNMGKALLDTLKTIELLYFAPENIKGIQRSSDNLLSSLFTVSRYLGAIEKEMTPTVDLLMRQATAETESVLTKIQRFYEIDFAAYQEKVENIKLPIFKTAMR